MISLAKMIQMKVVLFYFVVFMLVFHRLYANPVVKNNEVLKYNTSSPITTQISINKTPAINEECIVTCKVNSINDAVDTKFKLEIPEDAKIIEGELIWQADLYADIPVVYNMVIMFSKEGKKKISFKATKVIDEKNVFGDSSFVFITIGYDRAAKKGYPDIEINTVGKKKIFNNEKLDSDKKENIDNKGKFLDNETEIIDKNSFYPPAITEKEYSKNFPIEPNYRISNKKAAGDLTINGRWQFTGRSNKLESEKMLVLIINGDNEIISGCYTDQDGYYECGPFKNPGDTGLRSQLVTYSYFVEKKDDLKVIQTDSNKLYGVTTKTMKFEDGTYNIGSWYLGKESIINQAFWLTKDLIKVWRFVWNSGKMQIPQISAGSCTIKWQYDSNDGDYYRRGEYIHLKGDAPLSTNIVGHEYGHNIMYTVYGNWMPITYCPSPHYVNRKSHENCAWTEGWASFISIAANDDPVYRWASGSSVDMEDANGSWDDGDEVEGRVTASLWDIYDLIKDGLDKYSDNSFKPIWRVVSKEKSDNFKEFWKQRESQGFNIKDAVMCLLQNTIDYRNNINTDDYGDTCNEAHLINNNEKLSGLITKNDCDYFHFNLDRPSSVEIYTEGNTDTYGILFNCCDGSPPSNSCEVIRNDDSGINFNFSINTNLEPGDYYLKVRHYNIDLGEGEYILKSKIQ